VLGAHGRGAGLLGWGCGRRSRAAAVGPGGAEGYAGTRRKLERSRRTADRGGGGGRPRRVGMVPEGSRLAHRLAAVSVARVGGFRAGSAGVGRSRAGCALPGRGRALRCTEVGEEVMRSPDSLRAGAQDSRPHLLPAAGRNTSDGGRPAGTEKAGQDRGGAPELLGRRNRRGRPADWLGAAEGKGRRIAHRSGSTPRAAALLSQRLGRAGTRRFAADRIRPPGRPGARNRCRRKDAKSAGTAQGGRALTASWLGVAGCRTAGALLAEGSAGPSSPDARLRPRRDPARLRRRAFRFNRFRPPIDAARRCRVKPPAGGLRGSPSLGLALAAGPRVFIRERCLVARAARPSAFPMCLRDNIPHKRGECGRSRFGSAGPV